MFYDFFFWSLIRVRSRLSREIFLNKFIEFEKFLISHRTIYFLPQKHFTRKIEFLSLTHSTQ